VQASTGDQKEALQSRPVSKRSLYTDWQMSSFSSLAALSDYEHELIGMGHAEKTLTAPDNQSETIAVTGLPAGPNFGNMIHDLLETFPFTQLCSPEKDVDVSNLSVQKGRRYGVETETEKIAKFLDAIVTTTLPPGFSLASLKEERCLKEMMFYYHLGHLSTAKINVILSEEPTVQPLNHKEMRGYLTGFVDLICEYGGKYYLIDYKTNLLGERMADYSQENLLAAMKSHNYGLQYWIYSLILHQHLKNLFSDYSYGTHFGGVMYLFLRGMSPDRPGSGVFSTLPDYNKLVALEKVIGEKDNG
jgi:exodeoxyribonuclease V beta subunit